MTAAKLKNLRSTTSKQIAGITTMLSIPMVWKAIDPESWANFVSLFSFVWVIVPAAITYFALDWALMSAFGRRKANGQVETYQDPLQARLERIETAISRLHSYVQKLDPELAEEFRLREKFNSGDPYAGSDLSRYLAKRREDGFKTKNDPFLWEADPDDV
ncbi:hypothetical protein MCEMIH15_01907 [Caulobacteraceae bacterium]